MKKLVLVHLMLAAFPCVLVRAQQPSRPCGPPPFPSRMLDNDGHVSAEGRAWLEAGGESPDCHEKRPAVPAGTVPASVLAYHPPKAARRELDRGMQAVRKNRDQEALEHFAKAAGLDPNYVLAHLWLGTQRAKSGQADLALESFMRVVALEPNYSGFQSNVAWTLLKLHRPTEATPFARRALRLSPSYVDAHYALGLALVGQETLTPEAVAALRIAAGKHIEAKEVLAWVEGQLSAVK